LEKDGSESEDESSEIDQEKILAKLNEINKNKSGVSATNSGSVELDKSKATEEEEGDDGFGDFGDFNAFNDDEKEKEG
jgi:hypothetical protein